jgi:hypothetical protein
MSTRTGILYAVAEAHITYRIGVVTKGALSVGFRCWIYYQNPIIVKGRRSLPCSWRHNVHSVELDSERCAGQVHVGAHSQIAVAE